MDPNSARRALRISPDSPLTVELIERAHASESWARHPSRYLDEAERRSAVQWAETLGAARAVLLAEVRPAGPSVSSDAAAQPTRRRLSRGAIVGIVAGAVAVVALLTFAGIGAANLATRAVEAANERLDAGSSSDAASGGSGSEFVDRYQSGETMYAFPAALEIYLDGRYDSECPAQYEQGCWQMALFTEANCETLQVQLGFTNDAEALLPDHLETIETEAVLGNEPTPVVFGQDDYGYGWINQVTCLDAVS
ncbi:hypothetical protein [Agromyces bauzanensis]